MLSRLIDFRTPTAGLAAVSPAPWEPSATARRLVAISNIRSASRSVGTLWFDTYAAVTWLTRFTMSRFGSYSGMAKPFDFGIARIS